MAKSKRKRRPGQLPRRPSIGGGFEAEPALLHDVARALGQPRPWELLALASGVLTFVDPRTRNVFDTDPPALDPRELLESFAGIRRPETTGLIAVLAELMPDQGLAAMLRQELASRRDPLPTWLRDLSPLRVEGTLQTSHELGDHEQILIGVQTPAGDALTVALLINHNLGPLVKDASVIWEPIERVAAHMRRAMGDDSHSTMRPLDPAVARARATEAIDHAAMTYPRFDTETWPMCRPIVEWVLRHLPEGGTGYERPEWSEGDRQALAERFLASPFGRDCDDQDRDLLDAVLWFACDYGPGDPLRWSPEALDILFADWLPRKIVADVAYLDRAPGLLRRFVRYCHAERGIRPALTDRTVDAIDELEPEYRLRIRAPRHLGPAAPLAATGAITDELGIPADFDYGELALELWRQRLGGERALAELDDRPLPDEPLDWARVPEHARERVAEVLDLTDRCCQELLDIEFRTAARRLLADVAAADAAIFRRGRADTAAAAVLWIVAHANERFGGAPGGLTVKRLLAWFGVKGSVSQRAAPMIQAVHPRAVYGFHPQLLGNPRYLTSRFRHHVLAIRDDLLADARSVD